MKSTRTGVQSVRTLCAQQLLPAAASQRGSVRRQEETGLPRKERTLSKGVSDGHDRGERVVVLVVLAWIDVYVLTGVLFPPSFRLSKAPSLCRVTSIPADVMDAI